MWICACKSIIMIWLSVCTHRFDLNRMACRCDWRPMRCQYCGKNVIHRDIGKHEDKCLDNPKAAALVSGSPSTPNRSTLAATPHTPTASSKLQRGTDSTDGVSSTTSAAGSRSTGSAAGAGAAAPVSRLAALASLKEREGVPGTSGKPAPSKMSLSDSDEDDEGSIASDIVGLLQ
jgi:hypothetical protein